MVYVVAAIVVLVVVAVITAAYKADKVKRGLDAEIMGDIERDSEYPRSHLQIIEEEPEEEDGYSRRS